MNFNVTIHKCDFTNLLFSITGLFLKFIYFGRESRPLVETGGFEKSPKVEALSCFLVCSNKNDPLLFQLNLQSEQLCHKAKVRLHLSMKL